MTLRRSFAIVTGARVFSNLAKQIQLTVVVWEIYQRTKDPFALGLVGLVLAIPFILASLWAGHVVDHLDKRKVMRRAEIGLGACAVSFLTLSFWPDAPLPFFYLIIAAIGFCVSFETISYSAYTQILIPKAHFPKAAAWNLAGYQSAVILGPMIGGWILAHASAPAGFSTSLTLFAVSRLLLQFVSPLPTLPPRHPEPTWHRIQAGFRFIWSKPRILSAMSLDMVAVLFGDAVALYPIFADRLGGGPSGFGYLCAAPAVGAGVLSLVQARHPFINPTWTWLRAVVLIFGTGMVAFAFAPSMALALVCLVITGAADGVSVIIRQSIYQELTPDHMRGRVASVTGIFISTSNEIGAFEAGTVAKIIGVVPAVVFGGAMCLASVFVMSHVFKNMKEKRDETSV
jgi:MFS family permease